MNFTLKESRLGLRNSTTRIPFRYGNVCLERCPQAVLEATVEVSGEVHRGYSGDCLPPGWFDKTPGKDFRQQINEMVSAIAEGRRAFSLSAATPTDFFSAWMAAGESIDRWAADTGAQPLLASFGLSMIERAVMDALARATGNNLADALRQNLYQLRPGEVHQKLSGVAPAEWLPAKPPESIFVRHTVGLGDVLLSTELDEDQRLNDGFPQTLEEYIQQTGTRFFKIKVSNQLEHDLARLARIANLAQSYLGEEYGVTLDGNEQYKQAAQFDELIDAIRGTAALRTLWQNILWIEQPLERSIALDQQHTDGIRDLAEEKPVIIDESDGHCHSYRDAVSLGYRGVSSKNCKGAVRSILNAGLTWSLNQRGEQQRYFMSGEDLCSVGIIPVQSDLCLAVTLGLEHVERNGHMYHPGLSYLPEPAQRAALEAHPDFYAQQHGRIVPHVHQGRFDIGSLQCPGYGFATLPDMNDYESPDDWSFESLESEA